jgi:hypothetical protein
VKLFLVHHGFPRYHLQGRGTVSETLHYVPYWRFRGLSFTGRDGDIEHRVLDSNLLALKARGLPASLGVRPQVLKLRFVTHETEGRFLRPHFLFKTLPSRGAADGSGHTPGSGRRFAGLCESFIGETLSLIYAPTYIRQDVLYDAVLQQPIARLPEDVLEQLPTLETHQRSIDFLPTLCPHCGWDLQGERDTLVLLCRNCNSAWTAGETGLQKVDFSLDLCHETSAVYLPFWRMRLEVEGVRLDSPADLIRLANLPKAINRQLEEAELFFRVPAFKVQPQLFLRLAKLMTIRFDWKPTVEAFPKSSSSVLHPVTLPVHEAAESVPVVAASAAVPKGFLTDRLHTVRIKLQDHHLTFLPFLPNGAELIHPDMQISINRNALDLGRMI